MKTNEKQIRKEEFIFNVVSRSFIMLLIIAIITMMTSCNTLAPAARYAKEHRENNFYDRLKGNDSFTFKSVKDDFKTAKKEIKADNKKDKQHSRVASMQEKINKLK